MKRFSLLAASLALAASAHASLVFTNPFQHTEITQSGTLDLFDTDLGVLTGATLTLTDAMNTTITLTNIAAQSQIVAATGLVDLYFSSSTISPLGTALSAILAGANPVGDLSQGTGLQTLAAGATVAFGPLIDSDSDVFNLAGILGLLGQAGGGSFTVNCQSISGLLLQGGGGNIQATQSTQAMCGGSIVYTFDVVPPGQVPEPASLALFGLALAGAGFASRRRKA